jgi:hypothetical protein
MTPARLPVRTGTTDRIALIAYLVLWYTSVTNGSVSPDPRDPRGGKKGLLCNELHPDVVKLVLIKRKPLRQTFVTETRFSSQQKTER